MGQVPEPVGWALMPLAPIGELFGWLFALELPNSQAGFKITGMRCVSVKLCLLHPSAHRATRNLLCCVCVCVCFPSPGPLNRRQGCDVVSGFALPSNRKQLCVFVCTDTANAEIPSLHDVRPQQCASEIIYKRANRGNLSVDRFYFVARCRVHSSRGGDILPRQPAPVNRPDGSRH